MASSNFIRSYILSFGSPGGNGTKIGNVDNTSQVALHISFDIEKSTSETPNSGKIQVWNLSSDSLKIMETKDCVVELRAGYGRDMAVIISGNVTSVVTEQDGADRMTEIEIVDGMVSLRDTYITLSISGKVNTKDLYSRISEQMGVAVEYAEDLQFIDLPNGFSWIGKGKDLLQKITDCNRHHWTIQNGVLQITMEGKPVRSKGYLLSSSSGLIRIPKRITLGTKEEPISGWEIEYFLNGAIGVNSIVEIESEKANGYFLVNNVKLSGDNISGDWTCKAQVLEIKA